jgi:hypothetical protein
MVHLALSEGQLSTRKDAAIGLAISDIDDKQQDLLGPIFQESTMLCSGDQVSPGLRQ